MNTKKIKIRGGMVGLMMLAVTPMCGQQRQVMWAAEAGDAGNNGGEYFVDTL